MTTQLANDIRDFTNSIQSKKQQGQDLSNSTNAPVGRLDSGFDSVLGAANTTVDLIGPLSQLVDFLDGAAAIHPYIAVAVGPFKVLVDLELKRRTNNKKIDALYNRMGSMMAALKPLLETDQEPDLKRLQPLLEKTGNDISECGNMLDVYKKQSSIIRFIKSGAWQDKLVEFADKFIQHERDIGLCLSISTHLTTARIEIVLNQISAIIRQQSTMEVEFHRFVELQGGLETCVENDTLFAELVKKSGAAIVPEVPVPHPPQRYDSARYAPGITVLPPGLNYPHITRRQPIYDAADRPMPISSQYMTRPPPVEVLPRIPARGDYYRRPPSPPIRSPVGDRRGREYSPHYDSPIEPRSPRRPRSPEIPEDPNIRNIITQLKIQVTSALETNLDIMIQQNMTTWMIRFTHHMQLIQSFIESSKMQILQAIERGQSGHHERLRDTHMRKIWESEKWRSSVSSPTLLEGVHDHFWQSFQDAVAQGDFSQPIWTLQFLEKPYRSALSEVLDYDQSGLVSITEVNHFTDRKPEDLSLAVYLAVTALKCSYETTFYKNSLIQLIRDISEGSSMLSTDDMIQTASVYAENFEVIRSSLLEGIVGPPRHISDALRHHQLITYLESGRCANEAHWEECLKRVHWEIDGAEILNALADDKPIEQYLLPLLSVLLRHALLLIKMCSVISLDPRELPSFCESIYQVLNAVNARVTYLEDCFAQRNDPFAKFLKYACGMFSEWQIYIADPVQPNLEESSFENSSEEISSDDLDRLRDQLRYPAIGPVPATRPLPIARVTTVGELLPQSSPCSCTCIVT